MSIIKELFWKRGNILYSDLYEGILICKDVKETDYVAMTQNIFFSLILCLAAKHMQYKLLKIRPK